MSLPVDPKGEAPAKPVPTTTHLIEPVETQFLNCVCHRGYSLRFDLLIFKEYPKASAMTVTYLTALKRDVCVIYSTSARA